MKKHSVQTIKEVWYSLERINDDIAGVKRYDKDGKVVAKAALDQRSSEFGWEIVKKDPKNKSNDSSNLTAKAFR